MATKTELIVRLEELLQGDDPEAASEAVDTVKDAYEAIPNAAEEADRTNRARRNRNEMHPILLQRLPPRAPAVPIEKRRSQDEG